MKYIKTFEILNRVNVDYNKIYTMNIHVDKDKMCKLIGKIIQLNYGALIRGYVEDREISRIIDGRKKDWNRIREATTEEINHYNMMRDTEKYNL